ncbi:MAG: NAD(P)-dependent oxidoreductase [Nitrospiraceae bacterium]
MSSVIYLGPSNALGAAQAVLEPRWPVLAPEPTPESVGALLGEAVAVLDASMLVRFDRTTLDRAPALRVFSTATTGADHIDAQVLADRSIPLLTLAGERDLLHNLTPAAEHAWLLLMACARRIRGAIQHVLEGKWRREEFPGVMLKGKTLGLIGCGRIGSWMARYADAFQMDVVGYDPFVGAWPEPIKRSDLDSLLGTADFVSIHVPLNEQTRGMIAEREFGLLKPGAVFINSSRGGVTDEQALLKALREGQLGAVGLDVLDGEPAIDGHPLVEYARTHENLIITPHIGGFCPDAVSVVVAHAARRIARVLSGDQNSPDGE